MTLIFVNRATYYYEMLVRQVYPTGGYVEAEGEGGRVNFIKKYIFYNPW